MTGEGRLRRGRSGAEGRGLHLAGAPVCQRISSGIDSASHGSNGPPAGQVPEGGVSHPGALAAVPSVAWQRPDSSGEQPPGTGEVRGCPGKRCRRL